MTLFDVTLRLSPGLPVFPGNPPFALEAVKQIARGGSSNVSAIRMGSHSGTHVDAPRHFLDGGPGVDELPLDVLMGSARVIGITGRTIDADELRAAEAGSEKRLLIKTSNSRLWDAEAFSPEYVFLTEAGADYLAAAGVRLVGVDYLSIEEYKKPGAPAHRRLLGEGVVIVEGLDLRAVDPGRYDLLCLPLPIAGADGAPARVVLRSLA
jgi:arylformamidase